MTLLFSRNPLPDFTRTPTRPDDNVYPRFANAADVALLMRWRGGINPGGPYRLCRCYDTPAQGPYGFEGFEVGNVHLCQEVDTNLGLPYWRVWPGDDIHFHNTCAPEMFRRYFHLCPQFADNPPKEPTHES